MFLIGFGEKSESAKGLLDKYYCNVERIDILDSVDKLGEINASGNEYDRVVIYSKLLEGVSEGDYYKIIKDLNLGAFRNAIVVFYCTNKDIALALQDEIILYGDRMVVLYSDVTNKLTSRALLQLVKDDIGVLGQLYKLDDLMVTGGINNETRSLGVEDSRCVLESVDDIEISISGEAINTGSDLDDGSTFEALNSLGNELDIAVSKTGGTDGIESQDDLFNEDYDTWANFIGADTSDDKLNAISEDVEDGILIDKGICVEDEDSNTDVDWNSGIEDEDSNTDVECNIGLVDGDDVDIDTDWNSGIVDGDNTLDVELDNNWNATISNTVSDSVEENWLDDKGGNDVNVNISALIDGDINKGTSGVEVDGKEEVASRKRKGLFKGRGVASVKTNKSNVSATCVDLRNLKLLLDSYGRKGCSIAFIGNNSGNTTVVDNIGTLISSLGYSSLIVDLNILNRGLASITKDNYLAVHNTYTDSSSLREGLNSSLGNISNIANISKVDYHLLSLGLASQYIGHKDLTDEAKLNRFITTSKGSYNYILYDIPLEALSYYANIIYTADIVVVTSRLSNKGIMDYLLRMCNIENDDIMDIIFTRGKVLYTYDKGVDRLLGNKYNITTLGNIIDTKVRELVGCESEYSFANLDVLGSIRYSDIYDNLWGSKSVVSIEEYMQEYLGILENILK